MRENDLFFYEVDWNDTNQDKINIEGWNYFDNNVIYEYYNSTCSTRDKLIFKSSEDLKKVLENCKEDLEIYLKD